VGFCECSDEPLGCGTTELVVSVVWLLGPPSLLHNRYLGWRGSFLGVKAAEADHSSASSAKSKDMPSYTPIYPQLCMI
jgi:hypothetical protein